MFYFIRVLVVLVMVVSTIAAPATPNRPPIAHTNITLTGTPFANTTLAIYDTTAEFSTLSECEQGACPDFFANWDYRIAFFWFGDIADIFYKFRSNDCGFCQDLSTNADGCLDFTSCGRDQSICVDWYNGRAHRIWKDVNHKTCYSLTWHIVGDCGLIKEQDIYRPYQEVPCNW